MIIKKYYAISKRLQNYENFSISQRTAGLNIINKRDLVFAISSVLYSIIERRKWRGGYPTAALA
ncbi:MAG: hypothetical protein LKE41_02020 [Prevotella sp.]|jgi:hypothetical protein|nr:hypothetical protein [Prevotella sp.]